MAVLFGGEEYQSFNAIDYSLRVFFFLIFSLYVICVFIRVELEINAVRSQLSPNIDDLAFANATPHTPGSPQSLQSERIETIPS